MIEKINPDSVPQPSESRGELTVTIVGAGAAIESYGLCYFYNEYLQRLRILSLNLIDKVNEWLPNRHTIIDRVLNVTFPKLAISPTDIVADLTEDCISEFAKSYDKLVKTDILLIYNVMNEIPFADYKMVWRNLYFIINTCQKPLLILLMEPAGNKAISRVQWLTTMLKGCTRRIHEIDEEEISFNTPPLCIDFENSKDGLNIKLFRQTIDGIRPPQFKKSLKRTHLVCLNEPQSIVPISQIHSQLANPHIRRSRKGSFVSQSNNYGQTKFSDNDSKWRKFLK